jgi:PIN domain-containing protein
VKTAYIFIDFENVQPNNVTHLDGGAFKIKIFVGAKQSKISSDMVLGLQAFQPEYIKIEGSAPNALDLHIAYYIGRLAVQEPGSVFHIISKDRDYDPLIEHLEKRGITCRRWKAITDIPHARPAPVKAPPTPRQPGKPAAKAAVKSAPKPVPATVTPVDEIVENLERRARARPSTLKALTSTVKSHFRGAKISDAEVDAIVRQLSERGLIAVKDGKVAYNLAKPTT